jgi:hypothetical protein
MPVERQVTPEITDELVEFLKMKYPNELPKDPEPQIEQARHIGQQDVVKFLAAKMKEQQRLDAIAERYPNRT